MQRISGAMDPVPRGVAQRLLMTASSYPRHATDSAAYFLRELARHVAGLGRRVHVVVPDDPAAAPEMPADPGVSIQRYRYPAWPGARLAYGAGILPNLAARPWLLAQVPGFAAAQARALHQAIRAFQPDVIHAHWVLPQGMLAVRAARRAGIPVVVSAHGGDAYALKGGPLAAAKRWTLNRATAWTANTQATAVACAARGVPPPRVIPMGVDAGRFGAGDGAALKARLGETREVVLFVGRLVEKKGVGVLIEAWARLAHAHRARCALWVAGEGTLRRALEAGVATRGLNGSVRFLGHVPNGELPDYYAAATLCVVPSVVDRVGDTEGQGVVILEAMAAGLPVVASATGGIVEVVGDGAAGGVLVPPGDAAALARRLDELLAGPELRARYRDAARAHVREHYDWPAVARRFVDLYDTVSACRPPP